MTTPPHSDRTGAALAAPRRETPASGTPAPTPATASGRIEGAAIVGTLAWCGLVGWSVFTSPAVWRELMSVPLGVVTLLVVAGLPIVLLLMAVVLVRRARAAATDLAELRQRMDRLQEVSAAIIDDRAALHRDVEQRLTLVDRTQSALATDLGSLRAGLASPVAPPPLRTEPDPPAQPRLALDTDPDDAPFPPRDFIRALHFPIDEHDRAGFDVLRRALKHHETARLVSVAQDVLTLLAQDAIYVDDLTVHPADPVLWRAFADGVDGPDLEGLGGISDRSSLALTAGRMKDDGGFREAVHHFLRTFDQVFAGFAQVATDAEIVAFADTRTARAFMLCARVSGTFG